MCTPYRKLTHPKTSLRLIRPDFIAFLNRSRSAKAYRLTLSVKFPVFHEKMARHFWHFSKKPEWQKHTRATRALDLGLMRVLPQRSTCSTHPTMYEPVCS